MESQKEATTEWFLSVVDFQGRVTVDKNIRKLYDITHKSTVWVKIRKIDDTQ